MEHRSSTSYKYDPIQFTKNGIVKPQLPAKLREATLNLINTQQNHRKPEEGLGGVGTN